MPLEININENSTPVDLNPLWPLGTDPKSEGDDHIRNVKQVLANFYADLKFDTLGTGTIPAIFGTRFDESGLLVNQGSVILSVPAILDNPCVTDLENPEAAPIPYTPLGQDGPPKHYRTTALELADSQPVDSEVAVGPIKFEFTPSKDFFASSLTFRSNALVENVRVTARLNDENGIVLFRTASDEELRSGGGFTLNATGDTTVPLSALWTKYTGRLEFVTFDRYDSVSDQIVQTGIPLKGVTIGLDFNPFVELRGYPFVLTELEEKLAGSVIREIAFAEEALDLAIGVGTVLVTASAVNVLNGQNYRWRVEVLADHTITNDSYADISLLIDGVAVDRDGAGNLGMAASRAVGRSRSVVFTGRYTATADEAIDFQVQADIGAGTITSLHASVTIESVG